MRLFVAAWPPPPVVALLAALPRPERAGVRWTATEQWHVTLRFLGRAEPEAAAAALDALRAAPAEAELGPAVRRLGRGVLMVPVKGLDELATAVVECTAAVGEPPEDRRFRGHVTLARTTTAGIGDLVGTPVAARFPVTEVTLVASHLGRGPAHYEVLVRVPVGA